MQVRLRDAVINAGDPALNDGEEVLRGIDPDEGAQAGVLAGAVVYRVVRGELSTNLAVHRALIRHERGSFVSVLRNNRLDVLRRYVRDMEAAHATIALDKR